MKLFLSYGSLDTKKRILLFILISLCLCSVVFIFYNSLLPPSESSEQSDAVGGFIESILPEGAPITEFLVENVRVAAHFAEFFALGSFVALILVFFSCRPIILAVPSVAAGIFVGLLDETVQIFSGRGPEIFDVWVDAFGYFTATAVVISVYFVIALVRRKREN